MAPQIHLNYALLCFFTLRVAIIIILFSSLWAGLVALERWFDSLKAWGHCTYTVSCQGIFFLTVTMKPSMSLSMFLALIFFFVLASVCTGAPLLEGLPVGPFPQGTTTHTVFTLPVWATYTQLNGCLTSQPHNSCSWCSDWEVYRTFTHSLNLNESQKIGGGVQQQCSWVNLQSQRHTPFFNYSFCLLVSTWLGL